MVIPSITLASRKWKRGKKAECVLLFPHTTQSSILCPVENMTIHLMAFPTVLREKL